ncbi:TPA: hypothetical protein ACH3X1_004083 [Trebouxia sp. C0004]
MQFLRERRAPLQRSDRQTLGVPNPLHDILRCEQDIKRESSGHMQIYDVIVLPQQQPAVVEFAQHPCPQEVEMQMLTDPWRNLEMQHIFFSLQIPN